LKEVRAKQPATGLEVEAKVGFQLTRQKSAAGGDAVFPNFSARHFPVAALPLRSDDRENAEWRSLWHPGSAARGGSPSVKSKNEMCQPRFQNAGSTIKLGAQLQFEVARSRALKETRRTL
jgi:hypothetical protein